MYTVKMMISTEVKSSLYILSSASLLFIQFSSFIYFLSIDLATLATFIFVWPLLVFKVFSQLSCSLNLRQNLPLRGK